MKRSILAIFMITLMGLLAACGSGPASEESENTADYSGKSLMVYSGAGLRKPMDEIAEAFKEQYGAQINYNYAGSAQLLSQIELTQEGDVYIPGDLMDMEKAQEKGFVDSFSEVVKHIPVIGVPKGNPAGVTALADLAKPGIAVILGDPKSNAIGKKAEKILTKNNLLEQVRANVVVEDATVNEMVAHLAMEQGDASLIWEDNVVGVDEIEIIPIPEDQNMIEVCPIGVLSFSAEPELAQAFVDFVLSEEGIAIFTKHGFKPIAE